MPPRTGSLAATGAPPHPVQALGGPNHPAHCPDDTTRELSFGQHADDRVRDNTPLRTIRMRLMNLITTEHDHSSKTPTRYRAGMVDFSFTTREQSLGQQAIDRLQSTIPGELLGRG